MIRYCLSLSVGSLITILYCENRNERNSFNNHAMWWSQTAQSVALHTDETGVYTVRLPVRCAWLPTVSHSQPMSTTDFAAAVARELVEKRIPAQISADGVFVEEVTRPTPYHYESYTLAATLRAARLAYVVFIMVKLKVPLAWGTKLPQYKPAASINTML